MVKKTLSATSIGRDAGIWNINAFWGLGGLVEDIDRDAAAWVPIAANA